MTITNTLRPVKITNGCADYITKLRIAANPFDLPISFFRRPTTTRRPQARQTASLEAVTPCKRGSTLLAVRQWS